MNRPRLPASKAFLHVVNDHRWLVASACSLSLLENPQTKQRASMVLRNIDVAASASTLVYIRSLLEFYTKVRGTNREPQETDIVLGDFSTEVSEETIERLKGFKRSIEVHLLHLTAWRDVAYREAYGNDPEGVERIDWDKDYMHITESILSALYEAAEKPTKWAEPLKKLHGAATLRLSDNSSQWPRELTEKEDVEVYLRGCGLAP